MAVRDPLYYTDSGNFQEFSIADLNDIYSAVKRQFLASPSVTLTVVNSGGNLGNISETQVIASNAPSNNRSFGNNDATLGNVSTTTVQYSRINQTINPPASGFNVSGFKTGAFGSNPPIYMNDSGNFEPMTDSDFLDTFVVPAIQSFSNAAADPLYQVAGTTTPAGYSRVSNTPIYVDNNADIAAYSSTVLPLGTLSTVINNYYLVSKQPGGVQNQRVDVPYQVISSSGSDLEVNVDKIGTVYAISVNTNGEGSGYNIGDQFKILGTTLGGKTPLNDLTFEVSSENSGAVTGLTIVGTPVAQEYPVPITHTQNGDFKVMPKSTFDNMIQNAAQEVASNTTGYRLSYSFNSGQQVGTAMIDTRLKNPTQSRTNYQTGDTYYSQRVPTGGSQTQVKTHFLGVTVT